MKKRTYSIIILGFIFANLAIFGINEKNITAQQALNEPDYAQIEERVSTFFEELGDGTGTRTAYLKLFQGSPIGASSEELIGSMVKGTDALIAVGRWSFEYIDTKSVGKDVVQIKYLYKGEAFPVVWYFTYYRSQISNTMITDTATTNQGNWICIGAKFDTNLDPLFQQK